MGPALLSDPAMIGGFVSRLAYSGIETEIADEFLRRREAPDIANCRQNAQSDDHVDAGDCHQLFHARLLKRCLCKVFVDLFQLETETLQEGSDLRFLTAWPHPQNPDLGVAIYTAQRAQDISLRPTSFSTDYLVARGEEILRAGNYVGKDRDWRFRLSLPEALEDLGDLDVEVYCIKDDYYARAGERPVPDFVKMVDWEAARKLIDEYEIVTTF